MQTTTILFYIFCNTIVLQAESPVTIDGRLDETFWSTRTRVWTAEEPKLPDNSVRFHLGFDHQYLYFGADVTDSNVVGTHKQRKDKVWEDDAVEIFIDFSSSIPGPIDRTPENFEYGFSAAGGVNWTRGTSDGSGKNFPAHDWPPQWDSQVVWQQRLKNNTTLNDDKNHDAGYVIEAKIPLSEMGKTGPLRPDQKIAVSFLNICRPEMKLNHQRPLVTLPHIDFSNNHSPRLWQRINPDIQGPLAIRGWVEPLPLWLGTSCDNQQWKRFNSAESDPTGPWLNRQTWTAKLKQMRTRNLNALLLEHPHPFNGLLALENYPGACHFPPDTLNKHVEQFKWLLTEAHNNHIKIYLSCRNICLPGKWAKSQKLDEFGSDTPVSRNYMRSAVNEIFRTYPNLAGLVTAAGDEPPGYFDFVLNAIVRGLKDYLDTKRVYTYAYFPPVPELIFQTRFCTPKQARQIIDALPHVRLMHDLQYRQWFKPIVDPYVVQYETQTLASNIKSGLPAISTIMIGGPQASSTHLLWSDPQWMHELAIDLRRKGTDGMFLKSDCADDWLAREAVSAYSYAAGDKYNIQRWRKKLDEAFGTGDYSGQLLEAIQHASAIVPRFTNLIHDRSNRYMPQFGLPLIHYLEMPTLSSYPSGNETSADIRTPQTLTRNKIWANQDWGEQIASIRQQAGNNAPVGATLPSTIAQEIREHVNICRSRLTGLRHITPASPDQADNLSLLLDRIELNTVLGEHLYHKINAAIAWQRHQTNGGRIIDCTKPLEKSVEAWRTIVRLAEKLFPEPVRYWQSQIVSVPPWTQDQISKSYQLIQGHWRDQLRPFERELNLIHQRLSSQHAQANPPLWDILSAAEKQKLLPVQTISFDINNDNRIRLHKGAKITDDKNLIAGRKNSLHADTRQFDVNSWHIVATTNPQTATLLSYRPYQITFAYRIIDRGQGDPAPFAVGLMPEGGGEKIGENRAWGAPNGHGGWRIIKTPTLEHDNYVVFFAVRGRAAISIDMLNIETILK